MGKGRELQGNGQAWRTFKKHGDDGRLWVRLKHFHLMSGLKVDLKKSQSAN